MPIEIVGVAKDARYTGIREDPRPQVFLPYRQTTMENITMYVRTEQDPDPVMQSIRRAVAAIDPRVPIYSVSTMEDVVERSVVNERLIAGLSATLSTIATLLAVVGLYGVIAYTVTRRTREIGIRMALGALGSQIASGVLREAGMLVVVGLGLGFGAAWWLGRYVQSQLYGVTPADPATIALAAAALACRSASSPRWCRHAAPRACRRCPRCERTRRSADPAPPTARAHPHGGAHEDGRRRLAQSDRRASTMRRRPPRE